jgi:short-subunit dehydrogenase
MAGAGYVASKRAVLATTVALREEVPDHIDVRLICPGLVKSELSRETSEGMDTDAYASVVIKQKPSASSSSSHTPSTSSASKRGLTGLNLLTPNTLPRYEGDDEFDVRTLGAKHNWYPREPQIAPDLPV